MHILIQQYYCLILEKPKRGKTLNDFQAMLLVNKKGAQFMKKTLIIMILSLVFLNGCGTTNKLPGKTISPYITESQGESIYSGITANPNKDVPNDNTPYPDLISLGEKASNNNYKDGMLLLRDISYGGRKVLDLEYNELLEIWGSPVADDNDEMIGAVGFVILFNGDKLCRIVYGLPTAG